LSIAKEADADPAAAIFSVSRSDPGPLARLEDVKRDEGAPGEVFRLLTDPDEPMTLRQIAKAWGLPRGRFVEWFTTEHAGLYDAALKVRTDDLAHEALAIADEQCEVVKENGETYDPDVGRDKLRVDTRLKLAAKWDRKRYGEEADAVRVQAVTIQIANLRGETKVEVAPPVAALPKEGI